MMADKLDLYFRAHTIPVNFQKENWMATHVKQAEHALIFHSATTADHRKELLFGAYICAQLEGGQYVAKEIGLFCRDGYREELRALKRFAKGSAFEFG